MSLTCGFYNSIDGDRKYDSPQMSSLFDGIIRDGVFMSIGTCLVVTPGGGMNLTVGAGRAWFNHTWTYNDAAMVLSLDQSDLVSPRIDAVVLEINSLNDVRTNTIKKITGTPGTYPARPTWTNTPAVHTYPLAYVLVPTGATENTTGNITNMVGTSDCPFVTGPLTGINSDTLLTQWNAQFGVWFQHMKDQLDTDAAGHLQNEVDALVAADILINTAISSGDSTLQGNINAVQEAFNQAMDVLSNGGVSQAYLRDDAGKMIWRKGSATNDWSAPGNDNVPVTAASIQFGVVEADSPVTIAENGLFSITFPTPFVGTPHVIITPYSTADNDNAYSANLYTVHSTHITGRVIAMNITDGPILIPHPVRVYWEAKGLVALVG
jgi:hypothetical protein